MPAPLTHRLRRAALRGLTLGLAALPTLASAEPLVKLEGGEPRPGVVTAWTGKDRKVELTLAPGADPAAVAAAIEAQVERVKAKVAAGKVLVLGRSQAELLSALAAVDLGDDAGDALAAAAASAEETDSGSSLRAKKTANLEKLLKDQATTVAGKVAAVKYGAFPEVTVSLKVLRAPTGPLGKTIRKGGTIEVRPALKRGAAGLDLADENTRTNVGAWYLQKNDAVTAKLGEAGADGAVTAEVISR